MTDIPNLSFISAKLTRHGRSKKNESGHKFEHEEALREDAARQLIREEVCPVCSHSNREEEHCGGEWHHNE